MTHSIHISKFLSDPTRKKINMNFYSTNRTLMRKINLRDEKNKNNLAKRSKIYRFIPTDCFATI